MLLSLSDNARGGDVAVSMVGCPCVGGVVGAVAKVRVMRSAASTELKITLEIAHGGVSS